MPSAQDRKTFKSSHASKDIGAQGRSLIEKIQAQADKRRMWLQETLVQVGSEVIHDETYCLNRGRYEGLLAALAVLRSSSLAFEIQRSNERLGID